MTGVSAGIDQVLISRIPTEAALLASSAGGPDADEVLRRLLNGPLDWSCVLSLAARERAMAPLSQRLVSLRSASVPLEATMRMQRFAMISEFQLVSLHQRLEVILGLFADNGIDSLLLKGAGLAYSAYARPTDRPMGDIDLLVREECAQQAFDLALTSGWVRRRDVSQERSYEDHQHLPPLEDADGLQVGLELHTALFTHQAPFHLPAAQIWDRARRVQVGSRSALVPSAEDQLLHAALHFGWSHEMTFGTWRTLRDVERLAATGVDWDVFVRSAREARGATCCYWTLRLSRELAAAQVPDAVLAELSPRLPDRVLRQLACFFAIQSLPIPGAPPSSVSLSRALWSLAILPTRQGHGRSRPWLDTEEWVREGGSMRASKGSTVQRFVQQGVGFVRMIAHLSRS
ncbi:MAG: nucleotidyltransferase family protein [bacterium]